MTTAGLVASITAAAAGCGGGSSTAAKAVTTTTPTTVAGRGAGLQAFRQCMSTHGVTIPQRTGGGGSGGTGTSTSQPPDTGGTPGANGGVGGGAGRFLQPPAGVDPAKYQAALGACRSLIPTGGGGGGAGAGGAQFRTAYIAYVTCLRNHGVQTGDPALAQQALTGVDRTSAAFIAAAQACRPLLPQRNPGTTTTSTVGA
jgi:hypothetical protein